MAKKNKKIRFRLTGDKRPVSWELPITGMLLEKKNELGGSLGNRLVEWIPGFESPFKEDHKGDEKKKKVFFEDGVLDVDPNEKGLLRIIYSHKYYGNAFEKVDEEYDAAKDLEKYKLVEEALELINSSDEYEIKANGMVLIGSHVVHLTKTRIASLLKKEAFTNPKKIVEEMSTNDYKAKFVASMGVLRGVIEVSPDQTSVIWTSTKKPIIRIAVGQDPIAKLGEMLSEDTEEARVTIQTIGEESKRSYKKVVKTDGTIESEELLASKTVVSNKVKKEETEEEVEERLRAEAKAEVLEDLKKEAEAEAKKKIKAEILAEMKKDRSDGTKEDAESEEDKTEAKQEDGEELSDEDKLEKARDEYEAKFDKKIATAYKNNLDWILSKLEE